MNKPFFPAKTNSSQVNIGEAKTHLSELIARAERGETITLARNGVAVATLQGVAQLPPRKPGLLKGWLTQKQLDELDDPLPPEEQAALEGEESDDYGVTKPEFASYPTTRK
jgi:prevent-host-death family protein